MNSNCAGVWEPLVADFRRKQAIFFVRLVVVVISLNVRVRKWMEMEYMNAREREREKKNIMYYIIMSFWMSRERNRWRWWDPSKLTSIIKLINAKSSILRKLCWHITNSFYFLIWDIFHKHVVVSSSFCMWSVSAVPILLLENVWTITHIIHHAPTLHMKCFNTRRECGASYFYTCRSSDNRYFTRISIFSMLNLSSISISYTHSFPVLCDVWTVMRKLTETFGRSHPNPLHGYIYLNICIGWRSRWPHPSGALS